MMGLSRCTTGLALGALLGVLSACGGKSTASPAPASGGSAGFGGSSAGTPTSAGAGAASAGGGSLTGAASGAGGSSTGAGGSGLGGTATSGDLSATSAAGAPPVGEPVLCSRAGWSSASQVVLAHTHQGFLNLVHADGRVDGFDLTYPDKPNEEVQQRLSVAATADLVAVSSEWSSFSPTLQASLAMLDRATGELRFHTFFPGYYLRGDIHLSADGSAVVGLGQPVPDQPCLSAPGPCDHIAVVEPSGELQLLHGFAATGPRIDGQLLVTPALEAGAAPAWLDLDTGALTPLESWADQIATLQMGPSFVRYMTRVGDVVELLTATPSNVDRVEVQGMAQVLDQHPARHAVGEEQLVYVVDGDSSLWLLDLANGSLTNLPVPPPEGVSPFTCYTAALFVDPSGAPMATVRDDTSASVLRRDDRAGWQQLGLSVTNVQVVETTMAGGTYLLRGWAPGSLFCLDEAWQTPEEPLAAGDSLQLVRPADDILEFLDPPDQRIRLNDNGTCFFKTSPDGFFVRDVFEAREVS